MSDDELIRGPKWRTQTSPDRRHRAAVASFVPLLVVGLLLMLCGVWLFSQLGASDLMAWSAWWLPTIGVVIWTLVRPSVAEVTDDDDDSWIGYAIRFVLVGEEPMRPAASRVIAAVLVGAPVVWSLLVFGVLLLLGVF